MSEISTPLVCAAAVADPAGELFGIVAPRAEWLQEPLPEWYRAAPEALRQQLRDSHRRSLCSRRSLQPGQPQPRALMNCERDIVDTLAQIALMKGHIGDAAHAMLMDVLKPERSPRWQGCGVRYRQLHMLESYAFAGSLLHGVVLIQQDRADADRHACLVYLPGEPEHPLREYPCLGDFVVQLTGRLLERSYQRYFQRFIRADQSPAFFARLNQLLPMRSPSNLESLIQVQATSRPLFEWLYEQRKRRLCADVLGGREQSSAIGDTHGHVRFWGAPYAHTDHRQPEQDHLFAVGWPPAG